MKRLGHLQAARKFVDQHFPSCYVAILAGSTVRGSATSTSDLDIVIIDKSLGDCYRESFFEYGWPVEVFVHTPETILVWIEKDILRRKPSMPSMIAEGLLLRGSREYLQELKLHSRKELAAGPLQFSLEEDLTERYFLSDLLDDFIGSTDYVDEVFILNQILEKMVNFKMVKTGKWLVFGKRIQAALIEHDRDFADTFISAMTEFYQTTNKQKIVQLMESTLEQYGGRVFEGYSVGKT